ncbi:MAG: hypothetical protein M0Z41_09025 [Peptococcaceae bacterium]|nr:hypothetical protein [Peptococcaceae bacterium]
MSCYLRNLKGVLAKADLTPATKQERKEIDLAIRALVVSEGEKCPRVWQRVKVFLAEPGGEDRLVAVLKERRGG